MAHIFDPDTLRDIARKSIGLPPEQMAAAVIGDLAKTYHRHVESRQDWMFNIAGGATGALTFLHGSLSEYLIIFGSPVGTEGFSGRYRVDIYDIVLAGEMWTYAEDSPWDRTVYRPGDLALLGRKRAKGFRLLEGCWLLEYGRGPILTALPMGISGAVLSLDMTTIWKTLRNYGRLVVRELMHGKI